MKERIGEPFEPFRERIRTIGGVYVVFYDTPGPHRVRLFVECHKAVKSKVTEEVQEFVNTECPSHIQFEIAWLESFKAIPPETVPSFPTVSHFASMSGYPWSVDPDSILTKYLDLLAAEINKLKCGKS